MISILVCAYLTQSSFPSINTKHLPTSKPDFWFVGLGDNRPAGAGLPPTKTFKDLIAEIGIIGPDFVLSSGDLLYGNEETIEQYKQEIAWIKPVIQSLPCPFYNAAGNHELNNRADFLKEYTKAFGSLYGSFDFGGYRFLAVCTELPAEKPSVFGDQLTWLKQTLSKKAPTVVYQHHPVFVRPSNSEKETAHVDQTEMIHQLYVDGGVKLVVEGHDHVYNAQVHDGIDYRIAGGAGAPLDGPAEDGGYYHFVLVHAHDGKLDSTVIPLGTLETLPMGDGAVTVCDYADVDLPINNLIVNSKFAPKGLTASYTNKKKKTVKVNAKIVKTWKAGSGYATQISLVATRARATMIRLIK